ncbi:MAG: hypothetical protein [Siphoviridae sp. ctdc_1]|nr:MAG: hypothetical protein [Siphoviridae sp. ctdc_1]
MSKFLKWRLVSGGEVVTEDYKVGPDVMFDHICSCEVINGESANGNLIAAAPELLDALQGVVRVADRETDEFIAARAAIAKALGETK